MLDCLCSTQRFLCYWTNTTGMTHLKYSHDVPSVTAHKTWLFSRTAVTALNGI